MDDMHELTLYGVTSHVDSSNPNIIPTKLIVNDTCGLEILQEGQNAVN